MPFLREVPTTWDQTVVLKAEVGDVIALARRHGKRWFLCAMTDWTPRTLTLKLDFLAGGTYNLRSWADGPNAGKDATDTAIAQRRAKAGDNLAVKLAPGGGYAAIIEPTP